MRRPSIKGATGTKRRHGRSLLLQRCHGHAGAGPECPRKVGVPISNSEPEGVGRHVHEGRSPTEYETEQEAEAAAFECSKRIFDSSAPGTTDGVARRKEP